MKKTKIICTIGPASQGEEKLRELMYHRKIMRHCLITASSLLYGVSLIVFSF